MGTYIVFSETLFLVCEAIKCMMTGPCGGAHITYFDLIIAFRLFMSRVKTEFDNLLSITDSFISVHCWRGRCSIT